MEKKNLEAKQKLKALNKEWTDTQSVQVALEDPESQCCDECCDEG